MAKSKETKTIHLPGGTEGTDIGELFKSLVIFEETLEIINREVFGSPDSKWSAANAVKTAVGLCGDDLRNLSAGDVQFIKTSSSSESIPTVDDIEMSEVLPDATTISIQKGTPTYDPTRPSPSKNPSATCWNRSRWQKDYQRIDPEEKMNERVKEAVLWIRWCRYLTEYVHQEFPAERYSITAPKIERIIADGPNLEELTIKNLPFTQKELEDLIIELEKMAGQFHDLIDSADEHFTITAPLLRYVYEYIYAYLPEGSSFQRIMNNPECKKYNMLYYAKDREGNDVVTNNPQGYLGQSKVTFSHHWGGARNPGQWETQYWSGSLGQAVAEIAGFMIHEEVETYLLRTRYKDIDLKSWRCLRDESSRFYQAGRNPAHFTTQTYILHLAKAGFFDALREGRKPDSEIMEGVTLETIIQRWEDEESGRWASYSAQVAPSVDMNAYIRKYKLDEKLGWSFVSFEDKDTYPLSTH